MVSYKALGQSFFAEFLISFIFGYSVYAAILNTKNFEYTATDVVVPLAVAFSSIALIYTFIDHTICHFNPAITLAAMITLKLPFTLGLGYIVSQVLGFLAAVGMVICNFSLGRNETMDAITPTKVDPQTTSTGLFFTEFTLTGILVFVAFANGINSKRNPKHSFYGEEPQIDRSIVVPLTIGLTLGFLAVIGSSTSGGAFNPGIVFAAQLIGNNWSDAWKYYVGEFTGGLFGALLQVWILFK